MDWIRIRKFGIASDFKHLLCQLPDCTHPMHPSKAYSLRARLTAAALHANRDFPALPKALLLAMAKVVLEQSNCQQQFSPIFPAFLCFNMHFIYSIFNCFCYHYCYKIHTESCYKVFNNTTDFFLGKKYFFCLQWFSTLNFNFTNCCQSYD